MAATKPIQACGRGDGKLLTFKASSEWGKEGTEVTLNVGNMVAGFQASCKSECFTDCRWSTGISPHITTISRGIEIYRQKKAFDDVRDQRSEWSETTARQQELTGARGGDEHVHADAGPSPPPDLTLGQRRPR